LPRIPAIKYCQRGSSVGLGVGVEVGSGVHRTMCVGVGVGTPGGVGVHVGGRAAETRPAAATTEWLVGGAGVGQAVALSGGKGLAALLGSSQITTYQVPTNRVSTTSNSET